MWLGTTSTLARWVWLTLVVGVLGVGVLLVELLISHTPVTQVVKAGTTPSFSAAIDTEKESRDTDTQQLSPTQIATEVDLLATLKVNYITVDTFWNYPNYMEEWISAIRATGKNVWFRGQPEQWQDSNGTTGIMTPAAYLTAEDSFIKGHPSFFHAGDIFDPLSEPENGSYFASLPSDWSWRDAPNVYTDIYNQLILNTTGVANSAFAGMGIKGVFTNVRSTNAWFAENPNSLYLSTTQSLGRVAIDSYPEGSSTDPTACAQARLAEIQAVHITRPGLPIYLGEFGYSNIVSVSDATQAAVLQAEFNQLKGITYLAGANYWVGPGSVAGGGFTYILTGGPDNWTLRPAAKELANFFAAKLS